MKSAKNGHEWILALDTLIFLDDGASKQKLKIKWNPNFLPESSRFDESFWFFVSLLKLMCQSSFDLKTMDSVTGNLKAAGVYV